MSLTASAVRPLLRRRAARQPPGSTDPEELRAATERGAHRRPRGVIYQRAALAGIPALRATHWRADPDRVLLVLHGGAFVAGSAGGHAGLAGRLVRASGGVAYALEYRLAPEHPHPAAVGDAVGALRELAARSPGNRVAVVGDSAGGGIALSALHRLRDQGEVLPRCAVLRSPWVDLTLSAPSIEERADADFALDAGWLAAMAELYAPGRRAERGPSPLLGDQSGLPPLLVQVGGDEILRGDAERLAAEVQAAGGQVRLEVWEGMWHGWHGLAPVLPEARRALATAASFVRSRS